MSGPVKETSAAGGAPPARPGHSLMRSAGLISAFTFLSRILGLVREQVFAALLGAGLYADAFVAAFRIPNLLRDLFAEGALSAAFVPVYARVLVNEGRPAAYRLACRVLTVLAAVMAALMVLGFVFTGPLVRAITPGFEAVPGKIDITVLLTRVMLPFLPLVSFAAVAMGMLNAHERYAMPALAPALFNVVAIAWGGALWWIGFPAAQVAVGWAVGTLLGGAAQFLVQVPALWREGWRPRLFWAPKDPSLRSMLALMGPATVGLAAVQVNIFVSTIFASREQGALAWLQYAFRLLYLPIGVFGVAVGTIATTGLARRAAAGDLDGLRETLARALRTLTFLTVPATAGLIVLDRPIVRLLFERGRFTPFDTQQTAEALTLYATGLLFYTAVKVLAPAFYALGTPRMPLLASATAVATNLIVILVLHRALGFRAIALGTALGSVANGLVLVAAFQARQGGLVGQIATGSVARMIAAALAMSAACWTAARWLEAAVGTRGLAANLVVGLVPVVVGVVVYVSASLALRIPEAGDLVAAVRRRRRS